MAVVQFLRGMRVPAAAVVGGLTIGLCAAPAASAESAPRPRPAATRTAPVASPVLGPKSYAAAPLFPRLGAQWKRDRASQVGVYEASAARPGATSRHYGVRVWQELLTEHGFRTPVTGRYDRRTAAAVTRFQRTRRHLQASGRVDYPTARALLASTIGREAKRAGIPADLLWATSTSSRCWTRRR
ncbi:MAG: peptidoglycan-binding protein [Actinomycetota bacterium]|nr:peptidoglycan-binding protein [Actinomycetota bacterium]